MIFAPIAKKGLISNTPLGDHDTFVGLIYKYKGGKAEFDKSASAKMINDFKDVDEKIETISGSWLKELIIGDNKYWEISQHVPERYKPAKVALPSDYRYREDLIWLKRKNEKLADLWKVRLEVQQRRDRKLR